MTDKDQTKPDTDGQNAAPSGQAPATKDGAADAGKDAKASKATGGKPAAKAPAAKPPKPKATRDVVEVTGPRGGFWRAGLHFTGEVRTFEQGELTQKQLSALKAEPRLVVVERTIDPE